MRKIVVSLSCFAFAFGCLSAYGDTVPYDCQGPGGVLKADYPHKTTYEGDRVVKGKIGGGCTIDHADVTWNCI